MSLADFLIDCYLDTRLGIDTLDEIKRLNQEFGVFPEDLRGNKVNGLRIEEGAIEELLTQLDEEDQ